MELKDPKVMRALAHPLRIRLLELVAARGPITASQCAEAVDESPANCSFHLRTLAEHGYIRRSEAGDGRERPWEIVDVDQTWKREQDDPEASAASAALSHVFREWEFARIRAGALEPIPDSFEGLPGEQGATLLLTPDELRGILDGYRALLAPYVDRWQDRDARPEGSLPVRLFQATTLAPELEPPT